MYFAQRYPRGVGKKEERKEGRGAGRRKLTKHVHSKKILLSFLSFFITFILRDGVKILIWKCCLLATHVYVDNKILLTIYRDVG